VKKERRGKQRVRIQQAERREGGVARTFEHQKLRIKVVGSVYEKERGTLVGCKITSL